MARSLQPPTPVRNTKPRASSREAAAEFARHVQRRGGVVVFTNGVFDLLHPGHVRYLTKARRLGDVLIVGINSDRSVRANKGPERPINRAEERSEVLLGLACVDAAAVFDEDTPLSIITQIQPDILVKGAPRDGPTGDGAFVSAVNPRAVIATSAQFPSSERIPVDLAEDLRTQGIRLFAQDRCGAVAIKIFSSHWEVSAFLNKRQYCRLR